MPFSPVRLVMKEASSAAADTELTAVGVVWMSAARRLAVTTTSLTAVAAMGPRDSPGDDGPAWATCSLAGGAVATGASVEVPWPWPTQAGARTAKQTHARRPDREPLLQAMTRSSTLVSPTTPPSRRFADLPSALGASAAGGTVSRA